ncbi:hypothetical protein OBBRIDRAFT_230519 [Obba rivulosa]|uniref:Uncharacterized protein n=1 Tax=Obba rivulosa TaxID=1052685 RepID=A0A8E2DVB8_9APHY|nr:hypothetical protein OBBRIDRAFT_230519 [Obba rivulosa]
MYSGSVGRAALLAALVLTAQAQSTFRHRTTRLAGGAIAGVVIGCVAFALLFCICCMFLLRRRRIARNGGGGTGGFMPFGRQFAAGPAAGYNGAGGYNGNPEAGYGAPSGAGVGAGPETGYATGPGIAGESTFGRYGGAGNAAPAGGYAPPPGPPPAAHTKV